MLIGFDVGIMTMDWRYVIMHHVCPALGVILSTAMYSAAVRDLRQCILNGSLGSLNPVPWAVQTGNCFGWIVYAFYQSDLYLLGANLPGFLVSLWLNKGAVKLQFLQHFQSLPRHSNDNMDDHQHNNNEYLDTRAAALVMVPQERLLTHVILIWSVIMISVGWLLYLQHPARWIGLLVNCNLIFFYAAPLQSMAHVVRTQSSERIHVGTMLMNIVNTTFWFLYGLAQGDIYILIPNGTGLALGCAQGILCLIYPSSSSSSSHMNGTRMEKSKLLQRYHTQATSRMSSVCDDNA